MGKIIFKYIYYKRILLVDVKKTETHIQKKKQEEKRIVNLKNLYHFYSDCCSRNISINALEKYIFQ